MAPDGPIPSMENLNLSDPSLDTEDLFASSLSAQTKHNRQKPSHPNIPDASSRDSAAATEPETPHDEADHEASLRRELASVQRVNEVIEGVIESLERAKGNMDTVSRTVNNASSLLHLWTRILSQSEHNQRLILNPAWQGASQDIADMENESILRQQEKERRELDEAQRREASARKAEEQEAKRGEEVAAIRGNRGVKGRGGVAERGMNYGYAAVGGQGRRGVGRGTALTRGRAGRGIGRGLSGRGRGRSLS